MTLCFNTRNIRRRAKREDGRRCEAFEKFNRRNGKRRDANERQDHEEDASPDR